MNEIKFRCRDRLNHFVCYEKWYSGAWNKDGYWEAYPCWLQSRDGEYWTADLFSTGIVRLKDVYTGLHDKNNKEIFGGDWFKSSLRVNPFIIIWHNGSFRGKYPQHDGEGFHIDEYETKYGEVIGNIYENPELLENKDK